MIKYYKLLDTLNRRSMTKEELRQQIGISSATMSKISAHKMVSLEVIDKICCALNRRPGDIIGYIPSTNAPETKPLSQKAKKPLPLNQSSEKSQSLSKRICDIHVAVMLVFPKLHLTKE